MAERLRIAQIAPIAGPVSRRSSGSIEQLVALLTEELVQRGHDVTLFAAGDSQTAARLHASYCRGYDHDDSLYDWRFHECMNAAAAFAQAGDFDVIHSHCYHYALPFGRLVATPVVHTCHVLLDDDIAGAYARSPEAFVVAISHYQRSLLSGRCHVEVVPHGIDTEAFPFRPRRGDYLLFLGRVVPRKGVSQAIALARQVDVPLIIAGPADDEGYYQAEIAPAVDGRRVCYVGPVRDQERNALLAGAGALLFPLTEPEPFGLVLIEAMACGTPVAALELGAVPEIVDQGVTGYYRPDLDALAASMPAVLALDRAGVRAQAVTRFDYRRMTDGYLAVYRRLLAERGGPR